MSQSLYSIAQSLGCEVLLWEPEPAAGGRNGAGVVGMRFEVDRLVTLLERQKQQQGPAKGTEGEAGPAVRLVIVNFPHNPVTWASLISLKDFRGLWISRGEDPFSVPNARGAHLTLPPPIIRSLDFFQPWENGSDWFLLAGKRHTYLPGRISKLDLKSTSRGFSP